MSIAYSPWSKRALVAAAIGASALGTPAQAQTQAPTVALEPIQAGLQGATDQGLVGFYRARAYRPVWTAGGVVHPATSVLVEILKRASLDGMSNGQAVAARVEGAAALARSGLPRDLANAELIFSRAWAEYVQVLRRPVGVGMVYAADAVSPSAPFTAEILNEAALAPDLGAHLRQASQLNPVYSQLRAGLAAWRAGSVPPTTPGLRGGEVEQRFKVNLDRARALPIAADGRFILVDVASSRLYMYEGGTVRDSMKVVVGKTTKMTPLVAGIMRNVVLNPYWNVPPDLVQERVATGVLKKGVGYLKATNYELLADWSATPAPLDPKSVDWATVAAGKREVRVRQLPGPGNSMGEMKFNFPNEHGIYLHDTPDKSLFAKTDRQLSSGCIRLEDARRLARWLFGHAPSTASKAPEQIIPLPKATPVYVTYLTVGWDGMKLSFADDSYGRDGMSTSGPQKAAQE